MRNREDLMEAKVCLDMLAAGRNPSTGEKFKSDSAINEIEICRSLMLASRVVDLVIKNGGRIDSDPAKRKKPFNLEEWECKLIRITDEPVGIAAFSNRVTHVLDPDMKRIPGLHMTAWLEACGFLKTREWNDERMKVPTKAGEDLGITMVKKTTRDGRDYYKNLYNKEAQEFLVDHLDAIAGYQEQRKEAKKYGLDVDDIPVTGLKEDEPIPVKEKEIKNEKKKVKEEIKEDKKEDKKEERKEEKKTPTKKKKPSKKEKE